MDNNIKDIIKSTGVSTQTGYKATNPIERKITPLNTKSSANWLFNSNANTITPKQDIDLIHFVEQLFNVKEKELIEKITLEDIINFKAI